MCNLWGMLLPSRTWTTRSPPTFKNMYVCDICIRTYHWQCLLRTNCYNANERRAVDTYDTWACPACVNLSENEKKERTFRSQKKSWWKSCGTLHQTHTSDTNQERNSYQPYDIRLRNKVNFDIQPTSLKQKLLPLDATSIRPLALTSWST